MIAKLEKIITMIVNKLNYNVSNMRVIKSNRPDLCDYQCDDVFKLAKEYHKNPIEIGEQIVNEMNLLPDFNDYFKKVEFVRPGFINMVLSDTFINNNIKENVNNNFGILKDENIETFVIDYGGPNVAKPLHVGHMRTAIVGESIKRIIKYKGHNVIGDIHLGDYGLQIGQVIYGILKENKTIDDINIEFNHGYISVLASKKDSNKESSKTYIKRERTFGIYKREFYVGNVDYSKIFAKYKDGVLFIEVLKGNDDNNKKGIRPDKQLIQLYANGEKIGDPMELNEENNWTYIFNELEGCSETHLNNIIV